jgi:hypothetical protein
MKEAAVESYKADEHVYLDNACRRAAFCDLHPLHKFMYSGDSIILVGDLPMNRQSHQYIQMNQLSFRNHRLKFNTSGRLPIGSEEAMENISNQ